MCGIAGILSNMNVEANLRAMLEAMKHRGPDDTGTWCSNGVYLGHNRLSIIDLSPAGHQPMVSHSGRYVIVYNGEVYNFQSLRKDLMAQGVSFQSHTDTEVILALWEREGESCISRLRGMFAFAIWDKVEKRLTIVRDRLGIKPLYYAQTPNAFVFASEIKGILASGLVNRKVNDTAIAMILQKGHVQPPHTILDSVHSLMPGQLLSIHEQTINIATYWKLQNGSNKISDEINAISEIRNLIIQSVHEEMVSDRPVGVFLSGGLDSTVLVASLKAAGHKNIKTFTVGFDSTDFKSSEAKDAKIAAQYYGTEHSDIQIEGTEVYNAIDSYIEAIDQPSIDGLNIWLVSKKTSEHVTVAISGLGGDELFSGYSIDRNILYWHEKNAALTKILSFTEPIWRNIPKHWKLRRKLHSVSKFADFTEGYLSWAEINSQEVAAHLAGFPIEFQKAAVYENYAYFAKGEFTDLLQRITAMSIQTFMSGRVLPISDACSMAHSLEVRFPLIDHRLVELTYNLPQSWKIKKMKEVAKMKNFESENSFEQTAIKHLLYQSFKKELPPGFGRRAKRGFKLPLDKWMNNELEENIRDIFYATATYLPSENLRSLWDKWKKDKTNWVPVWVAFILESWIAKYIRQ